MKTKFCQFPMLMEQSIIGIINELCADSVISDGFYSGRDQYKERDTH